METKYLSRELGKWILITVAVSGVVILAATSPGFGYILKEINRQRFKKYQNFRINQAFKRLEKQKLISISEKSNGEIEIKLLEKGKGKVLTYKLEDMQLKKGKWDGLWRIVIFDIPEDKKAAREVLRQKMKNLGFYTLQESVLVTPWDCKDEIDFIKHFYQIENYVKLIEARKFDGMEKVKDYFKV